MTEEQQPLSDTNLKLHQAVAWLPAYDNHRTDGVLDVTPGSLLDVEAFRQFQT